MRVDDYVPEIAADPRGTARTALVGDEGEQLTYGELACRVERAAIALTSSGVTAGHRVALVGENTIGLVVALLATIRLGAWAVPLNARMAPGEIDSICEHCEPRLLVFDAASVEAAAHGRRHGARATAEPGLGRCLLAAGRGETAPASDPDVALMLYTSGSTGRPKGVMLTHGNMDFVTSASLAQGVLLPGDRIFHALPLSHSFGLVSALLCALRAGATVQLCSRFSAERLADALQHMNVTVFQGVPAMYARLIEWADRSGETLKPNHLRLAYIGGSQIAPTLKSRAEALLGLRLHHGYGLTESAPAAARTFGHPPPKDITAGWPIPGIELVVRGSDGSTLPQGEAGEVCIRGPNVMRGYFRDPEQTRLAIDAKGWLHTGDIGRFGPAGDLTIVGRSKEMIIRGGFNVFPAEVEAAIGAFPGVAQCAVLGRAVDGDEEVIAFIEPQAAATIDLRALEYYLRSRIAPYKIPRRWHVMDRLPAAPTGKLLKPALRNMLAALDEKQPA